MNCAFLTSSVSRLSGGLFTVMRGLAGALQPKDVNVTVLGVTDAHTAEDLPTWRPIEVRVHAPRAPHAFANATGYAATLRELQPDIVHGHGLWQYPSLVGHRWARRQRRPHVVAPHGMLDPWALAHARWKKRIVAACFEDAHLRGANCLHAVSTSEAQAMRAYGLRNPVCVVPNGVDFPPPRSTQPPPWSGVIAAGRPVLLFLGRLHPKKGLTELITAWQAAQGPGATPAARDWALAIAGWDQGGLRAQLEAQVRAHGAQTDVHFIGPLHGESKAAAYQHAAAFILPSFSEGMPAAVLEAWSYRLPVLMTPACNLPEGFTQKAALRMDPTPTSIRAGLETLFALSAEERQCIGHRGEQLVAQRFAWPVLAGAMHAVYGWLLGGGTPPPCVEQS